jgi:hypothetical protein
MTLAALNAWATSGWHNAYRVVIQAVGAWNFSIAYGAYELPSLVDSVLLQGYADIHRIFFPLQ